MDEDAVLAIAEGIDQLLRALDLRQHYVIGLGAAQAVLYDIAHDLRYACLDED